MAVSWAHCRNVGLMVGSRAGWVWASMSGWPSSMCPRIPRSVNEEDLRWAAGQLGGSGSAGQRPVGQPDPALRHQAPVRVGDVHLPELEGPALADRPGLDVEAALPHRAEEVGHVVDPDGELAAGPDGERGPDAGRRLHGAGVERAVDDP